MRYLCYLSSVILLALSWSTLLTAQDTGLQEPMSETISLDSRPLENPQPEAPEDKAGLPPQEDTFGVPVPVIGIDPNEGTTLGVILAIVSESEGRLSSIIAPVFTTNPTVGYSLDFNYFGFPTKDISYQLYFSQTTKIFWEYSVEYNHRHFLYEPLDFTGKFIFRRKASSRFYGFGQESEEDDESNYTLREVLGEATFTLKLLHNIYGSIGLLGRYSWVRSGTVEDVATLDQKFPTITGNEYDYSLPVEAALEYDSRDSKITPSSGLNAKVYCRVADKSVASSFSMRRYGAMAKCYLPMGDEGQFVTALRGMVEYLDEDGIPFYELSSIGGGTTLRGFGEGRFYDRHRIVCNAEERIRLWRFAVGEISLDIETALFVDAAQVFPSFRDLRYQDFKVVVGGGLRLVVRSQIVAKVDMGYGSEGTAIYAGLHYPF